MFENKHIEWFVLGAVYRYLESTGNVSGSVHPDKLNAYFLETMSVVHGYLRGTKTLDGTCSDFQCVLATEAATVFGKKQ